MAPVGSERPSRVAVQRVEEGEVSIETRLVKGAVRGGERKYLLPIVKIAKFDALGALIDNRSHKTAGGRWLDDDILDELLTLIVNGGRGERLGDGVDRPTKSASLSFPYVREPNNRTDLPLPAFLRS